MPSPFENCLISPMALTIRLAGFSDGACFLCLVVSSLIISVARFGDYRFIFSKRSSFMRLKKLLVPFFLFNLIWMAAMNINRTSNFWSFSSSSLSLQSPRYFSDFVTILTNQFFFLCNFVIHTTYSFQWII